MTWPRSCPCPCGCRTTLRMLSSGKVRNPGQPARGQPIRSSVGAANPGAAPRGGDQMSIPHRRHHRPPQRRQVDALQPHHRTAPGVVDAQPGVTRDRHFAPRNGTAAGFGWSIRASGCWVV